MLPENATPASHHRYQLARQIAATCPPTLAADIALTGSSARGWATDDSDLELNLWSETLPPLEERTAWLTTLGVRDLDIETAARDDDSYWIGGVYEGVPVEFGWQTHAALDATCDRLLSGTVTDRSVTFLATLILNGVPLRDSGAVSTRQIRLRAYPDTVQRASIQRAVAHIKRGHVQTTLALAARGETISAVERLVTDLDAAIQVVYAAHRQWMPTRKWTLTTARTFAPPELVARFQITPFIVDPQERIRAVAKLLRDALALVPCDIDVYGTLAALE